MFKNQILELDQFNFVKQTDELVSPALTSIEGVFVAGAASGPKDIPDSILSAGCAATEVAGYLINKSSSVSVPQSAEVNASALVETL